MPRTLSVRLQTALVIALFLASSATVLFSVYQTWFLPQREFEVRDRLREASRRMANIAEPELGRFQAENGRSFEALNERLRETSNRVLADFPGVEGGFYLNDKLDRFAGFAFPTDQPDSPSLPGGSAPVPKAQRPPGEKGTAQPSTPQRGDEPPPKEAPFILVQVKHSLALDSGEFQFDVRTVGLSRVAIVTEPVGANRPARLATWTMYRVSGPESMAVQLRRFQVATGLALGGILLAVVLALNLGRTLKRQRAEQDHLREDLRRSEHLAALGKLLAGVAHEVRNPLAGIRSTVQLWERLPDTARSPDSIHAVILAVDRLNEIVSRLLYFARVENAERQPVSVNSVLTETLNLLDAQAASQSIVIERDLGASLPGVSGSATALRQVFLNLATNALQAMPQGGRLCCRTRYAQQNGKVEISFGDTGPGIPPDVREHLFEPFFTIKVNCAALSPTLLESELFGHEKGAFTGAVARRVGRFEQASRGTLFLDEIGDLDIDLQAKLLRALQTGQFERVGGNETLQVDVRVIAATNRDLAALIAEQQFREDLLYRLNVVTVELPPLRARTEDIPHLAEHIVRRLARKYHWPQLALAPDAVEYLRHQPWPGNVRQMQNVLGRAAILVRGRLILADDLVGTSPTSPASPANASHDHPMLLKDLLAETERRAIQHALEQTGWNRTQAARLLGISRRQLFDKIQQYGLQP